MKKLLANIKNDIGNLTCPNCHKTAIIKIIGEKVKMNIDCPKDQSEYCYFFDQLDNRLRKHASNPPPKNTEHYIPKSSKFVDQLDNQLRKHTTNPLPKNAENYFLQTANFFAYPSPNFVEFKYTNPAFLPTDGIITNEQFAFYNYFKSEISRGRRVELYGNRGYIMLLVNEYLEELNKATDYYFTRKSNTTTRVRNGEKKNFGDFSVSVSITTSGNEIIKLKPSHQNYSFPIEGPIEQLIRLNSLYDFIDLGSYIGDVYCFGGKFQDALRYYTLNEKSVDVYLVNKILNIKTLLGLEISPIDILCIRKKITDFGLKNLDKISECAGLILMQGNLTRKKDFLAYINTKYKNDRKGNYHNGKQGYYWQLFDGGTIFGADLRQKFIERYKIKTYCYYQIQEFIDYCNDLSRKAENLFRKSLKLPNVGEGWLSETELFYKIKEFLSDYNVIQHASPKWLGRQHLDIFIPDLNLAFEFHGKQHFEPVGLFGGQKGFEDAQRRDKMKREKCKANNVLLIEVKEGYDFNEVVKIIETFKTVFRT